MKSLDLKSTLVAGAFGAAILIAIIWAGGLSDTAGTTQPYSQAGMAGFVVGAGVQMGVRLAGVS